MLNIQGFKTDEVNCYSPSSSDKLVVISDQKQHQPQATVVQRRRDFGHFVLIEEEEEIIKCSHAPGCITLNFYLNSGTLGVMSK